MGLRRQLRATGRLASGVYESLPAGDILGSWVVNQETCGLDSHFRPVTDRFAASGNASLAPRF